MMAFSTWLGVAALLGAPYGLQTPPPQTAPPAGQTPTPQTPPAQTPPAKPPTLDNTIEAGEADTEEPERKFIRWNEFDGKYATFKFGGGFLYDVVAYTQDANSKEQFDLVPGNKVRDARLTFKGRLKFLKRNVTYTMGLMYDGPSEEFLVRETGVMFQVMAKTDDWGYIFVGRTKEGFSLNKVMVGYAGWTMERQPINDAAIPILADGVKWLGYSPKLHLIWNVGLYNDAVSARQSFSTYGHEYVGRIAWVPVMSEKTATVFHLGLNLRHGHPEDGTLKLRSRPESFISPYFVDTGDFAVPVNNMIGPEIYYRPGRFLFGSEYYWQMNNAPASGDPLLHGGEVVFSWLVTGETRVYNTRGGFFNQVAPLRPVFGGGPGAWEIVAHFSRIDLDSGTLTGGKFWRFTPMVNWYLSDQVRLELSYAYGSLSRFGLVGRTSFFQSRIQLQF